MVPEVGHTLAPRRPRGPASWGVAKRHITRISLLGKLISTGSTKTDYFSRRKISVRNWARNNKKLRPIFYKDRFSANSHLELNWRLLLAHRTRIYAECKTESRSGFVADSQTAAAEGKKRSPEPPYKLWTQTRVISCRNDSSGPRKWRCTVTKPSEGARGDITNEGR